ncbi:hypothetical protein B0H19DRAFT_1065631 [Mycena capillaripes]|nr:hypothetical protein B0H19DRAFT_1065631 [Mycena capillaripes]
MPRINCRINESNPANAIVKGAQLRCPLEILNPVKLFPTHASPLNAKILQCFSQLYGLFPLDLGVSCKQQPDGRHITINLLGVVKHCKSFSFSVSPFVINGEPSFFRSIEYRRPHRGILKEQLLDIHYEGNASVVNTQTLDDCTAGCVTGTDIFVHEQTLTPLVESTILHFT